MLMLPLLLWPMPRHELHASELQWQAIMPKKENTMLTSKCSAVHQVNMLGFLDKALEEDQLGPRRPPYSDARQKRLAVQEGATALICTLMPAIEPVSMVRSNSSLSPVVFFFGASRRRTQDSTAYTCMLSA